MAVAARFGIFFSEKGLFRWSLSLEQVTGATLNFMLKKHFQDIATGHFVVRRLERKYGSTFITREYHKQREEGIEVEEKFSPVEG